MATAKLGIKYAMQLVRKQTGLMADEAGGGQGTRASGVFKRWVDPTAKDVDIIKATADGEMW